MNGRRSWLLYWAVVLVLCLSPAGGEVQTGGGGVVVLPDEPPLVALTFDDGPHPIRTRRLMEGLAAREVPATFFLVGSRLEGNEELVRELARQGHQIGIHTWDHVMLTGEITAEEYLRQMSLSRAALRDILGEGEYWLRPPYGILDRKLRKLEEGPLIIWSVDPEDWKDQDRGRMVASVLGQVRDGDIILMHDIFASSVDAGLEIVDGLLERGYCFVTVEQLLTLRGVEPTPGRWVSRAAP